MAFLKAKQLHAQESYCYTEWVSLLLFSCNLCAQSGQWNHNNSLSYTWRNAPECFLIEKKKHKASAAAPLSRHIWISGSRLTLSPRPRLRCGVCSLAGVDVISSGGRSSFVFLDRPSGGVPVLWQEATPMLTSMSRAISYPLTPQPCNQTPSMDRACFCIPRPTYVGACVSVCL